METIDTSMIEGFDGMTADEFQSTLPVWGATGLTENLWPCTTFQSTLPVWGATASMHKNILVHL